METLEQVLTIASEEYEAGRLDRAARLYEAAVCIKPSYWYSVYCLGTVMARLGNDGIAIPLFMQAIQDNPKCVEAIYNLGLSMRRQGHTKSAQAIYTEALKIDPNHSEIMAAMAGCFINEGNPKGCVEWADKSLSINPDNHRAKHHKSLGLLELGDFDKGFELYQNRRFLPEWHERTYQAPKWNGEKVKTLLIHGEQGIGDEILFMSWLPKIRHLYDKLVIECTPRMVETFKRSFDCEVFGTEKEIVAAGIEVDAVVPMGSLPHFAKGLPPKGRYLIPDEEKVLKYRKKLLEAGPGPYIGLSWHGGVIKTHAHHRSTDVKDWKRFTKYGTCISVQYGDRENEAEYLGIPHWKEDIANLDDLTALLTALDITVTVNNTTVHMCGALDKACWTLTPKKCAWRYQLEGEKMPWYDSVKQFRQEDGWGSVFDRLEDEISKYCDFRELMAA
jgi:hypothetical protein